jgi:NADH-quinone oxidoreductase subunit M
MDYLIPITILLPLLSGLAIFLAGYQGRKLVPFGVAASLATFLLSVGVVYATFNGAKADPNSLATVASAIEFAPSWLRIQLPVSISNHLVRWQLQFGVDGIGALMVLLTGIVTAAVCIFSIQQIRDRLHQYIALILITESMLMGVFMSMDLVSFYLFFEAVLLPLILLINGWGNPKEALSASRKFLLFTLAGSVPMVIGFIGIALQSASIANPSTVDLEVLSAMANQQQIEAVAGGAEMVSTLATNQQWILWLLLLGFGIKLAVLPLHTWLPSTYAVANPNTTALIASVVAKLGVFGIVRIVLPMTPIGLASEAQILFASLGAIAIVYGAFVALSQSDLRKVFAYSSISHMGFVTMGLMSLNTEGMSGAAIQMFNHGIITCAMFLLLGMLEQRRANLTFTMEDLGMAALYPRISVLLIFFTLAGAGLPGLNGFVGELLAMMGMTRVNAAITAIAVLGTVLGAWYGLRIVQRLMFGSDGHSKHKPLIEGQGDCASLELTTLAFMAIVCLYIGVRPSGPMKMIEPDIARLAKVTEPASKIMHPDVDTLAQTAAK